MTSEVAVQSRPGRQPPLSQRLAPLGQLRAEIDRWFEDVPAQLQQLQAGQIRFPVPSPAIDMTEADDSYQLTAEVPGIDAEDVQISVTDGMLRIAGEKREERAGSERDYSYSERSYGRFERELALPADADTGAIKARVNKGSFRSPYRRTGRRKAANSRFLSSPGETIAAKPPATNGGALPCDTSVSAPRIGGLVRPILIGPPDRIAAAAEDAEIEIASFQIIATPHSRAAAAEAWRWSIEAVRQC